MVQRCKAKAKHSQQQCRQPVIPGREVCHYHGGKTPIGPGLPQFKTGHRSKFLPSRMAADYYAAEHDPKLMELRSDIATVDARIIDLLKRVDTGEAGSIWAEAQAAWMRLRRAQVRGHIETYQLACEEMGRLVDTGGQDTAAWLEIGKQIELRRRLVESEQRRLTLAHEVLTADRAMVLLAEVIRILQRHVTDRRILGAIAAEMQGSLLMGTIEVEPKNGSTPLA
jgi:hypothetical protein